MNIKEAVEWLEEIEDAFQYKDIESAININGYKSCEESIEVVLNELDNKDKIINEMANFIEKDDIAIEEFICPYCKYQLNKECTEKECIEQIIDYFTKKCNGGRNG